MFEDWIYTIIHYALVSAGAFTLLGFIITAIEGKDNEQD
jgi:hypothetical protein